MTSMPRNTMGQPAPQAPSVFGTSAGAYNTGVQGMNYAMNPMAVPMTMNQFLNPFRDQVISDSLGRLRDRRNEDLSMVQTQAAQSGAFGGSRHGLVEAQLMEDYGRQEDELAYRMLQEGFDISAGMGLQRLDQVAGIGGNLVNAAPVGFNMGNTAIDRQLGAGAQQRAMAQSVMDLASQQFAGYVGYPQTSLNTALSGIMGNPLAGAGTQTTRKQAGLFDFLSMGAGVLGAGK